MATVRSFEKEDLDFCEKCVKDTWNLDKWIKNTGKPFLDRAYAEHYVSLSNHLQILEENGKPEGFIFCRMHNLTFSEKIHGKSTTLKLGLKIWNNLLLGHFGNRRKALTKLRETTSISPEIAKREKEFDAVVNLFMINSGNRGKGFGKLLLNNFINECKENDIKTIGLFTDSESDYGFYTQFGFVKYSGFNNDQLKPMEDGSENCIILRLVLQP